MPAQVAQGANPEKGRAYLRDKLGRVVRGGMPAFQVDSRARRTLAAISAGYARKFGKPDPEPAIHRTLMEGIESALGLVALGLADDNANWSYTADGRRYRRYGLASADGRAAPHRLRNPNYPVQ